MIFIGFVFVFTEFSFLKGILTEVFLANSLIDIILYDTYYAVAYNTYLFGHTVFYDFILEVSVWPLHSQYKSLASSTDKSGRTSREHIEKRCILHNWQTNFRFSGSLYIRNPYFHIQHKLLLLKSCIRRKSFCPKIKNKYSRLIKPGRSLFYSPLLLYRLSIDKRSNQSFQLLKKNGQVTTKTKKKLVWNKLIHIQTKLN